LDGHSISNSHWPLKDEEAIEWCKRISSFHWTRGTSSRKVMEAYQTRRHCVYARKGEEREEWSMRKVVGSNVCKDQAWRECVQGSSIERVCVRIRHEKDLCSKYLLQSLWTFVLISCSSQIYRWIFVKIESVLV
jgi:hypothetical protein